MPAALPAGFTLPAGTPPAVTTAIFWAVSQLDTPYHFGGDCTDPHSGDPDRQCDCSCLVILSQRPVQGCDLRDRVDYSVVDTAVADTAGSQCVGGIEAMLQSFDPVGLSTGACGGEVPR